jgi:lysozyme
MLKKDEGLRLKPYKCSAGKLTIGYGRNLEDYGITEDEAEYMLENNIEKMQEELYTSFPWLNNHDEVRQNVIENLCYNMGLGRLKTFKNMFHYLQLKDYENASKELLNSRYAIQVKDRAVRMANMLKTGKVDKYYLT